MLTVVTSLVGTGVIALFNLAITVVRLEEKMRTLDCDKPKPRRTAAVTAERPTTVLSAMGFGFLHRLFLPDGKASNDPNP